MIRARSYRQSSLGIYSDINFIDSYFLGIYYALGMGFPVSTMVKNPFANAGDVGSIPESGRSPGEGNGNQLQHSCLGNLMDRRAWQATVHGVMKELDKTDPVASWVYNCK